VNPLPPDLFVPARGTLNHWIIIDPDQEIAPRLSFSIDLPFRPFHIEGEEVTTALWIGGLDSGLRHWRELAHSEPVADPIELDGIIRLFSTANPVEIESLAFGAATGSSLAVELRCHIDFEAEGHDEYGIVPLSLSAHLDVTPLRVSKAIETRCRGDAERIQAELAPVIDLTGFAPLEKVPGGYQYPLQSS